MGRWLAAAGCGLVLVPAFPPYGLWPLAVVAVAAFAGVLTGQTVRRGALLGLVFGLVFCFGVFSWIRVIGPDAWVALSLLEAAFLALLGAALTLALRVRWWPLWGACLWVGEELLRSRIPFGGLPWGRLAFSQAASPFTAFAAWGGAPLVTFVTALAGCLLAYAVREWFRLPAFRLAAFRSAAFPLAAAVALGAAGSLIPLAGPGNGNPGTGGERTVTLALVQGNVPRSGLDAFTQPRAVLRNHVRVTGQLAEQVRSGAVPRPDLVVWPENSSDLDPYRNPEAYRLISGAVAGVGVPTLVGAVVDGPDSQHVQNMGIVWDPVTGPGQTYVKRHPVPFGEYLPFRALLSKLITRFDRIPRDFHPGSSPGVLTVGPARLADVICFEVAYDNLVRDAVNAGGELIVVQTNNATYGRTGQPDQQLAAAQLRAVEHGRAVVTPATSGISAIIGPDGRLVERSREFTSDLMVRSVPLLRGRTFADRVGAGPEWLLSIIGVLVLLVRAVRAGARPSAGSDQPGGEEDHVPQLTASSGPQSTETAGKAGT